MRSSIDADCNLLTKARKTSTSEVAVGAAQGHAERRAAGIDPSTRSGQADDVALGTRFAPVGRVRPSRSAPLLAATLALSSEARDQSSCPAPCRRSSSAWCSAAHTPACCQSRKRRQQLMPEPQPISCSRCSHGSPVREP